MIFYLSHTTCWHSPVGREIVASAKSAALSMVGVAAGGSAPSSSNDGRPSAEVQLQAAVATL